MSLLGTVSHKVAGVALSASMMLTPAISETENEDGEANSTYLQDKLGLVVELDAEQKRQEELQTLHENVASLVVQIDELEAKLDDKESYISKIEAKLRDYQRNYVKKEQQVSRSNASKPYTSPQQPNKQQETATNQAGKSVGTFNASYYGMDCVGCSGRTASGYNTKGRTHYNGMRVLAADTSILPLGTIVKVEGSAIGSFTGIVLDRGGAIKGRKLDILVGSEAESSPLGRQNVSVSVVKYGDNKYRKVD